jgi:L-ribulose-5-phosphate 3-epimerase
MTRSIDVLLLDIDGVLTDGRVWVGPDGAETKAIAFVDIDAVFRMRRAGIRIGFITGEATPFAEYVRRRFEPELFVSGRKDKLAAFRELARDHALDPGRVAFAGDSHHDIDLLRELATTFAPADAHEAVRAAATQVLRARRGGGVVEEIADRLLATTAADRAGAAPATPIGVMQGRLLPAIDGRIQAFPWDRWPEEFDTARAVGFDLIEFVFEGPEVDRHPLLTHEGRQRIRDRIAASGVAVDSICADYFMDHPLHRGDAADRVAALGVLERLIEGAAAVGARLIEIPCVDRSSLDGSRDESELTAALAGLATEAEGAGVGILLETDLPPMRFRHLLERFDGRVGANYDTGNSASLGYDPTGEVRLLGPWIRNVHVKDRVLGGTTVPLGSGDARFDAFFAALADVGYAGAFILQTARDPDDVGVARRYLQMVRSWVDRHLPGAA